MKHLKKRSLEWLTAAAIFRAFKTALVFSFLLLTADPVRAQQNIRTPDGTFPRIASLWWGEYQAVNDPAIAQKVQIFLAPNFTISEAATIRAVDPNSLILNTINAEETTGGVPVVPDRYYLKDVNGKPIQDWPGNPGNFILNLTNPAVVTLLAQFAYQQYAQAGFAYDGIFFDNVVTTISNTTKDCFGNPVQIDANGDGIPDDALTLDAAWSAGVYSLIAQFRQLAPTAYISGHINQLPPAPQSLAVFNGDSFGFDAVNVREGTAAFGSIYDSYQQWFAKGRRPTIAVIQSSPPNQIAYGYGYSPLRVILPSTAAFGQNFYPNMRFGLGMALMNDGFFDFDFGDSTSPVAWWYDEYDFNLGTPVAPAMQIGPGAGPNELVNGGFETGQAPWLFAVNNDGEANATFSLDGNVRESGVESAHIAVSSTATANWHIDLEQDALPLSAGTEYQVKFWAKADSDVTIQVVAQGGAPSFAQYGLDTPVSIGPAWASYSVSFLASTTAQDGRLEFWFGNSNGNIWIDSVQMEVAPSRTYRRDFENGVVLLNGTSSTQTISLEYGLQRFTGKQAPRYQYIVDDASPSFSTTGLWNVATFDTGSRMAYGPYYHAWQSTCHELDAGIGTAEWSLGTPQGGRYTIQVWLPAAPGSATWTSSAVYEVVSGSTVLATKILDQSMAKGGDQWFTIATVNLSRAIPAVLRLHNSGTGPLIADAVYVFSTTARYNDGSAQTQVSLSPMDSILLQRAVPNQTIIFPALSDTAVGGRPTPLSAESTSGQPVVYVVNTPELCKLNAKMIASAARGTCSVTATQPGNAIYRAAVPVTQEFNISGPKIVGQTITFPSIRDTLVSAGRFVLQGNTSSSLPVSYSSNTPLTCTLAGSTVSPIAKGACSITAVQLGNEMYEAATPISQTFTVRPGIQHITFPARMKHVIGSSH